MTYPSNKILDPELNIHRYAATGAAAAEAIKAPISHDRKLKIETVDADYGKACDYESRARSPI